jgi:hypothetical protein
MTSHGPSGRGPGDGSNTPPPIIGGGKASTAGQGGKDPSGVQIHHIASDKAHASGFTGEFKKIFDKGGMSLQDKANKMPLPGHANTGSHSLEYHRFVLRRLQVATKDCSDQADCRKALKAALYRLRKRLEQNPRLILGEGLR